MKRAPLFFVALLASVSSLCAQSKWSAQTAASAVADADYTLIVQGGTNKRATFSLIRQITASQITDSTTVGRAILTASNPSAIRFIRINADNTVTLRTAAEMLSDLGGGSGTDADAIHDNVAGEIAAITDKATPVAADHLLIEDSAASDAKKDITVGSQETALEGVMDLQDMQGAVTDGQVPNTITIDAATTATNVADADKGDISISSGVWSVDANSVALTTDTTGNYVTSVATTAPITGGAAGSEGATLTIALDQTANYDWTGEHTFDADAVQIDDTNASHQLILTPGSNLTADRVLTLTTGDAARTLTLSGDATISGTNTGDQTITLTGDVTGSGTGSFATSIASNVVAAAEIDETDSFDWTGIHTFDSDAVQIDDTNASHQLVLTPGSDLTADRVVTITTGDSARTITLSGDTTLSGTNTGDQTITLTGDVTGSGTGSFAATVADNSVDGTDIALGSDAQGDVMYYDGTNWVRLAAGTSGQVLHTNGAGANPAWDSDDGAGGGAPTDADYLVGTANGSLSAEIVVGTSPGGELGGTWASPTIDADAVLWNEVGDAGADATIAMGAHETDFTSTIDASGEAVLTLTNTDADAANDNSLIDLRHNDGADANVFYARFVGDNDGTPINDYLFSQTAFTIGSGVATTFSGSVTVPNDSFALGTKTTGNYVVNVDTSSPLTGGSAGSEGASLTLDLDEAANFDWTGEHTFDADAVQIDDTNASHQLVITPGSNLTADRVLTITTGDAARTVTLSGDTTLSGTNTGDQTITLTGDVTGSGTGSFAATIADNSVDGTDIAVGSDAQGDILYYDGTNWVRLGAGTSGHFLQTQGTGANPQWAEGGAGGGAPTGADYLVGTANGSLSAEIVVGTSPGGELGGTWASPTIDADAVSWSEIGDATGFTQIYMGGHETDITADRDTADNSVWTIYNGDDDAANDNSIIDLKHDDGDDANVFYLRMIGDEDGTPKQDYLFSQTGATFNKTLSLSNGATSSGELRILEDTDAGSNYASFAVPSLGANTVYVLPADDGDAGEQLQTDGSGNLTWEAAGGGGGGAPTDATYITQTSNGTLSAEQALSSLSTGIMRVATTTGVITSLTDSSGIASNISDETGTGALVLASAPAMVGPIVGNGASGPGYVDFREDTDNGSNRVRLIGPASVADIDVTLPTAAGTIITTANTVDSLASSTSANLRTLLSDETGTGNAMFTRTGVRRTVYINAGAMIPRVTNGAASGTTETTTNDVMFDTFDFDSTTEEGVGFWWTPPSTWDAGTLTFKAHWTASSGSGTVDWDFAARCYNDDDAIDQALGTEQGTGADTLLATGDMHITATTSALTVGGTPTANRPVYVQVARDVATDTLNADAKLIGVTIEFTESTTEPSAQ